MDLSYRDFEALLAKSNLLSAEQIAAQLRDYNASTESPSAKGASSHLLQQGVLTDWQCGQLLAGKSRGFILGKYRLLSPLGGGGMGAVFLGEHIQMRRKAAIKVIAKSRLQDERYLQRFVRESQAIAQLHHRNIVHAYDFGHDADRYYLAMEYIDGKDLERVVTETGPLSVDDAVAFIHQAAVGLGHAHEHGIIHRDIKPSNLIVASDGTVKILDLGLALIDSGDDHGLTKKGRDTLGTTDYMAPEQALDSHAVNERADIYSLGCTLYFLLTGHPPFPAGSVAERLVKHQTAKATPIDAFRQDVPERLAGICGRMMEKQPRDRISTAVAVAEELSTLIASGESTIADGDAAPTLVCVLPESSDNLQSQAEYSSFVPSHRAATPTWIWGAAVGLAVLLVSGILLGLTLSPGETVVTDERTGQLKSRPFVDSSVKWIASPPAAEWSEAPPSPPAVPSVVRGFLGYGLDCGGPAHPDRAHGNEWEPSTLTISAWVNANSHPTAGDTRRWLVSKNSHEVEQGHYGLLLIGGHVAAYLNIGGGAGNIHFAQSPQFIEPGSWHHLAMSYDGARLCVYYDGKEVAALDVNKPREAGTNHLRLGQRPDGLFTFDGKLDEVRIYNRALSASEIERQFANPVGSPRVASCDSSVIGYWSFEEIEYRRKEILPAVSRIDAPRLDLLLNSEFARHLSQGCGWIETQAGQQPDASTVKVTPDQRYNERISGMRINIRENPGQGEYRYLRFAWKKQGGDGIAVQLAHEYQWGPSEDAPRAFRYHAGPGGAAFGDSIEVAADLPSEWTTVTRDLFADFGEFTLTGVALTPFNGDFGLFDQISLAKTLTAFDDSATADVLNTADPKRAPLFLRCGDSQGEVAAQAEGYGFQVDQGDRYDGWQATWPHCWYHPEQVRFRLTVPAGTTGHLILVFCDGDTEVRSQTLLLEGKPLGTYRRFHVPQTIAVPVTAQDTSDGVILVELTNHNAELNAVVSAVAFVPK